MVVMYRIGIGVSETLGKMKRKKMCHLNMRSGDWLNLFVVAIIDDLKIRHLPNLLFVTHQDRRVLHSRRGHTKYAAAQSLARRQNVQTERQKRHQQMREAEGKSDAQNKLV
jgi:hypothetical protein